MKIKKFRIKPRMPSVGKILKGLLSVRHLPEDLELSLPQESENFLKTIIPTAFYSTWTHEKLPFSFQSFLDSQQIKGEVAVTAVVATVGHGPEELLSEMLMNGETTRSHVITALSEESADLSFSFISRLLAEDAEHDGCEISSPMMMTDPVLLTEILNLLESDHEQIHVDAAQHLTPRFTRVGLFAWIPIKKRKREHATTLQKKAS